MIGDAGFAIWWLAGQDTLRGINGCLGPPRQSQIPGTQPDRAWILNGGKRQRIIIHLPGIRAYHGQVFFAKRIVKDGQVVPRCDKRANSLKISILLKYFENALVQVEGPKTTLQSITRAALAGDWSPLEWDSP